MSLLSQKDREIAIAALEKYIADASTSEYSSSEVYALLNWIKLEYQKNS